jgi:polyphenol oxidase
MMPPEHVESVPDLDVLGINAFTTTRAAGSFGSGTTEPVRDVMGRWDALRATLAAARVQRLATAAQVHGSRVLVHGGRWEGWLRSTSADGHLAPRRGTALAVTVADCVPVFIAHGSGAVAMLHSGWRGTAARIVEAAIEAFAELRVAAADLSIHLGPAICGPCYEVSAEVARQVTGQAADAPVRVDLRSIIAGQARARGVRHVTISPWCTRHHNDRFFSHRAGDAGRQIGVIYAPSR